MSNRSGQRIDNYHLIRCLGTGSFGDVYLGEHLSHNTQVAVKVLRNQLSQNELYSILTEARIFRLKHPNIVSILDFGIEQKSGTPFLVMDYIPNGTLRQRHLRGTLVPLDKIIFYIRNIAEALQYAHEERFIHRDIKPENMLVGRNGEILLSDFGIAVLSQSGRLSSQSSQNVAGTLPYMAPEQLMGKPSRASDQYALGIIVYEWLSGECPFQGTNVAQLSLQHLQDQPPPLRQKIPTVIPEVEKVVMTALAKKPQDRYANVHAFAVALEEAFQRFYQAPTFVEKTKEQWMKEGDTHYQAQQYKEAIVSYHRAIDLDPQMAIAYFKRAIVYQYLKEYQKAIADYNQVVNLGYTFADVYYNRGLVYVMLQAYRSSIQDFDRALALEPRHTKAQIAREKIYRMLKEKDNQVNFPFFKY